MEEAERLCDRVAIIDHGRIVDMDTPARLIARHAPERTIVLTTEDVAAAAHFKNIPEVRQVTTAEGAITIAGEGEALVTHVIACLAERRIQVTDFRTMMPSLEDVFLRVTGHSIRD
jgi:ABC-2 type transport system ATP-binding protein